MATHASVSPMQALSHGGSLKREGQEEEFLGKKDTT